MQPGGVKNLGTYLSFQRINSSLGINFTYIIPKGVSKIKEMKESSLKIKLDDGRIFDLKPNSKSKISYALGNLLYTFQADISKDIFDKIINQKIDVIRFNVDNILIDVKFTTSDKNKIDKAANCLQ